MTLTLAIAQLNPTIGDLAGNAQQLLTAAEQAASQGAHLLLTPELSLCGYPPRDLLMHPGFLAAMQTTLTQLAHDLPPQLTVLVGTVEANPDAALQGGKPLYNSMALLQGGTVRQIFHKRLLPTYDVFDEDRYFEPGQQINHFWLEPKGTTFQVAEPGFEPDPSRPALHLGVTICEDLWNDEEFWGKRSYTINPIADLANLGVDLIINLSASPYTVGKQHVREAMLRHSAIRHSQPVIYVNQVGGNDDLIFDGHSFVFDRRGELVCRARGFEPDLVLVEFDPTNRDFVMPPEPSIALLPECEDAEMWAALVLGVRDYARKCGFRKLVLGLSGGVDSALVAAIATAAVGAENVLGVLMPSPYSSQHSVTDALALAQNLSIQTQTLPIGELMSAYDHSLSPLFANTEFGLAEENIQSRIRGNLLMAISNKFGHLLLSTGNKSEVAVGYCTLYGDMNGGLAVIADVPKTRVYSICHWLNGGLRNDDLPEENLLEQSVPEESLLEENLLEQSLLEEESGSAVFVEALPESSRESLTESSPEVETVPDAIAHPVLIPESILTKPPSAELKPGQVDQDSLPAYEILDEILVRLIHNHQTPDQIVAAGHNPAVVNQIIKLVTRAEFKRRQAPPVLKVTDRAFGTGWRMPIASRWVLASSHAAPSAYSSSQRSLPTPQPPL